MRKSKTIRHIDNQGLCLGCGLCESICGSESVEMKLGDDGFFHPEIKKPVKPSDEEIIARICPGLNVVNDIPFGGKESIWGHIEGLWSSFSTDSEIRTKGSSGGVGSGLAIYMLERGIVDGVLQVGGDSSDYLRNSLKVSYNRFDVLDCASSRYAPALIFDRIFDILDSDDKSYAFIGKPCDISGLKNLLTEYPKYGDRIKMTISIMCAGLPSFNGTQAIIDNLDGNMPVRDLKYRGNGWPGFFSFTDANDQTYQMSYNDTWGKVLNKHLKFRCKVCPDGIGIQADIVVGDAWETADGYPDFTEREGQSLVIARTQRAVGLLGDADRDGRIRSATLDVGKIRVMQPYQYGRRLAVGARILALFLKKGVLLNFRNMSVYKNMRRTSIRSLARQFLGTYKRVGK